MKMDNGKIDTNMLPIKAKLLFTKLLQEFMSF